MRQLLFILLFTFILSEITFPSVSDDASIELTMTKQRASNTVEIIAMPKSMIADSIFNKQLRIESGNSQHSVNAFGDTTIIINGKSGATGIAQFLPSTWNWLKEKNILPEYFSITNENHQRAAQRFYMNYLAQQDYGIDYDKTRLAIASYNVGKTRVMKLIKLHGQQWEEYLSPNAQKYINLLAGQRT